MFMQHLDSYILHHSTPYPYQYQRDFGEWSRDWDRPTPEQKLKRKETERQYELAKLRRNKVEMRRLENQLALYPI